MVNDSLSRNLVLVEQVSHALARQNNSVEDWGAWRVSETMGSSINEDGGIMGIS